MATVQEYFPVGTQAISMTGLTAVSSATLTGGIEFDAISNVSTLDLDHIVTVSVGVNAIAVTGTQIQIWVVPCQTDDLASSVTWPDVFDGTASSETVTSAGVLKGCGRLALVFNVDFVDATKFYCAAFSVAALFSGVMPTRYVLFLTQNTTANIGNTSGDWHYQRIQAKVS